MKPIVLGQSGIETMAQELADYLDVPYQTVRTQKFANGEIKPCSPEVTGKDVYLVHSMTHPNPSEGLVDLLLTLDGIKRADAHSVSLVTPFMTYQRQDRVDEYGAPLSARVVADVLSPYIDRLYTADMHSEQIQGMYTVPVTNVKAAYELSKQFSPDVVVVSPDQGGLKRAKKFAQHIGTNEIGMIAKERVGVNQVVSHGYHGPSVEGKEVVLVDDLIDTGGSLTTAAHALYRAGATQVTAAATHGVFSHGALKDLSVVVTNSIERSKSFLEENKEWLTQVSLVKTIGKEIAKRLTQ